MASNAQTEANRRNAQKSTGPRTREGKTTVSQNALRHGLCAGIPLMDDEDAGDTERLLAALIEENQPYGANEEILVYQMAEHFFFQKRASCFLAGEMNKSESGEKNAREIGLMLRYHTTAVRGFSRALNDLRKLQKERKLQEIGFDSQKPEEAPAEPPAERPTPAAAPPKTEPVAATSPVQPQIRVEPTVASPAEPQKSGEKGRPGQPHTSPRVA
jgi:hypothetical protein